MMRRTKRTLRSWSIVVAVASLVFHSEWRAPSWQVIEGRTTWVQRPKRVRWPLPGPSRVSSISSWLLQYGGSFLYAQKMGNAETFNFAKTQLANFRHWQCSCGQICKAFVLVADESATSKISLSTRRQSSFFQGEWREVQQKRIGILINFRGAESIRYSKMRNPKKDLLDLSSYSDFCELSYGTVLLLLKLVHLQ